MDVQLRHGVVGISLDTYYLGFRVTAVKLPYKKHRIQFRILRIRQRITPPWSSTLLAPEYFQYL